jgi:gliding motility-associated-like protein
MVMIKNNKLFLKLLSGLLLTMLSNSFVYSQLGTCSAPVSNINNFTSGVNANTADTTTMVKQSLTTTTGNNTPITMYYSVNTSASGAIGIIMSVYAACPTGSTTTGSGCQLANGTMLTQQDINSCNLTVRQSRDCKLYASTADACSGTNSIPYLTKISNSSYSGTFNPVWSNLQPNNSYVLVITYNLQSTCSSPKVSISKYDTTIVSPPSCSTCASATCKVIASNGATVQAARSQATTDITAETNSLTQSLTNLVNMSDDGSPVTICVPVTVPADATNLGFKHGFYDANGGCALSDPDISRSYKLYPAGCGTPVNPKTANAQPVASGFNPEWDVVTSGAGAGKILPGNYIFCYTMSIASGSACYNVPGVILDYYTNGTPIPPPPTCKPVDFEFYDDAGLSTLHSGTSFTCSSNSVYLAPKDVVTNYFGSSTNPDSGWPFPVIQIDVTATTGNLNSTNTTINIYDAVTGSLVDSSPIGDGTTTASVTGSNYHFFAKPGGYTFSLDKSNTNSGTYTYTAYDVMSGTIIGSGTLTITSGAESAKSIVLKPTNFNGSFSCATCGAGALTQGIAPQYVGELGIGTFDPVKAGVGSHNIVYTWDNGLTGALRCTGTKTITITVTGGPTITPSTPVAVCKGSTTTTMAYTSTGTPTKYSIDWNPAANTAGFGDVVDAALSATPQTITVPAGAAAGTYTGSLTVKNAAGCSSAPTNISVTISGIPTINGTLTVCQGLTTQLTGSGTANATNPWVSGTTANATVSATGLVTGVAAGSSVITYKDNNGCTNTASVSVTAKATPTFAAITSVCQGATAPILPLSSTNATPITGTWSPVVSTAFAGTITYTFTPTAGLCANTATNTITVNAKVTPTFAAVASVCLNASSPVLPLSSTNATPITGTWLPVVSTATAGTTTYTFTPTAGLCANTATTTITVNPILTATISCGTSTTNSVDFTWPAVTGATAYTISYDKGNGPVSGGSIGATNYTVSAMASGSNATLIVTPTGLAGTCFAASTPKVCTANNCPSPSITTHPSSVTKCSGTNAQFSVVSNPVAPQVTYKWQISTSSGPFTDLADGGVYSGATTGTLAVSNVTGLTGNQYRVVVTETTTGLCSITSNPAILTVNTIPTATISGTTSVCANASSPNVTLTGANGVSPYTFSYTINGGASQTISTTVGNSITIPVSTSGASVSTFAITNVSDGSVAACNQSVTGQSAVVTVNSISPPSINCGVTSQTDVPFSWTPLAGATGYTISYTVNGGSSISGGSVATTTYNVSSLSGGDVVVITVLPTGTGCFASSNQTCTAVQCTSPTINSQPQDITKCGGASASFSATYTGQSSVIWQMNNAGNWTDVVAGGNYSGENTGTLVVADVTGLNGTQFRLKLNEALGTCPTLSNVVTLSVNPLPTATISGGTSVCKGATGPVITFQGANGTSPYTFVYKINNGASANVITNIGNSTTLITPSTTLGVFTYDLISVSDAASCTQTITGQSTIVTVNPIPTVDAIRDTSLCSNILFSPHVLFLNKTTISSTPPGATFTWTNSDPTIGLASNGVGDVPSFTTTNNSPVDVLATIRVKPTLNGCVGNELPFNITVKPFITPQVDLKYQNLDSVEFGWNRVNSAISYIVEESINPAPTPSYTTAVDPINTDTIYRRGKLAMGDKITIRVTPVGDGCYVSGSKLSQTAICVGATVDSQPKDISRCDGDDAFFTIAASNYATNKLQWQESTDGGVTWNDLSENSIFASTGFTSLIISDVTGLNGNKYRVKLLDKQWAACPSYSNPATLVVNSIPQPQFVASDIIGCAPFTTSFTDNTANPNGSVTSVVWDFNDGSPVSNEPGTTTHTFNKPGKYPISLKTTIGGCTSTKVIPDFITVTDKPTALFKVDRDTLSIFDPEVKLTNLSSKNVNLVKWTFGDGSPISSTFNTDHTYAPEPGPYKITLIVSTANDFSNASCTDTYAQYVYIPEDLIYYVPNTFTPNGDENNNVFQPIFTTGYDPQHYTFTIFDRWGQVVFVSHNSNIGWDGTYGDKILSDNTYVWKLEFNEKATGKEYRVTGYVNLIK